jgi:hypothetical protein
MFINSRMHGYHRKISWCPGIFRENVVIFRDIPPYSVIFRHIPWYSGIFRDIPVFRVFTTPRIFLGLCTRLIIELVYQIISFKKIYPPQITGYQAFYQLTNLPTGSRIGISRNMAEYGGIWRNITEYHDIFPEYTGTSQYFPMVANVYFVANIFRW